MPQDPHRHHHPSWRVEAHVMDLETAVKDGILDGGNLNSGGGLTTAVKLDLKKMIEELDTVEDVPTVFICPISLQPMLDPVTLCTGQTYERSNIVRWLSMGHLTCPTTMQELWDETVTPNRTLHQLIYAWFSQRYLLMKKRSEDVHGCTDELIDTLRKVKGQARVQVLKELHQLVSVHGSARKAMVELGGVGLMCSLLGPFTSHAVGSEVLGILVNLNMDFDVKCSLMQPARMSLVIDMLNEGTGDTKLNCVRLIEMLMEEKGFRAEMVSSLSLLVGMMRLVRDVRYPNGVSGGLRLMRMICAYRQLRKLVVSVGVVGQIVEMLPGLSPECTESALSVLDALSSVSEGKIALMDCPRAIPVLVRVLMRVSENCTRCALNVLGELCRLSPEECGVVAVEAGMAAKLLLVLQSGSNQLLKLRAAELLKLCSLNYSATHFISKCKLTRTIQ